MRASYHRLAVRDVRQILDHYESEAGSQLADRFFSTLLTAVEKALRNPRHFPPSGEVLRRVNLDGFPYHILFEDTAEGIKVLVVRHHKRHPAFGLKRR